MKVLSKSLTLLSLSLLLNSCILDFLEDRPSSAAHKYEEIGINAAYFNKTEEQCWRSIQDYILESEAKLLYSSQGEGLVKAQFAQDHKLSFELKEVTANRTYITVKVWDKLLPSSKLSDEYFKDLSSRLK